MLDYETIKKNAGKTIKIDGHSTDAWRLAEIMTAIGFDKEASKFKGIHYGLDGKITEGVVKFLNGTTVYIN